MPFWLKVFIGLEVLISFSHPPTTLSKAGPGFAVSAFNGVDGKFSYRFLHIHLQPEIFLDSSDDQRFRRKNFSWRNFREFSTASGADASSEERSSFGGGYDILRNVLAIALASHFIPSDTVSWRGAWIPSDGVRASTPCPNYDRTSSTFNHC